MKKTGIAKEIEVLKKMLALTNPLTERDRYNLLMDEIGKLQGLNETEQKSHKLLSNVPDSLINGAVVIGSTLLMIGYESHHSFTLKNSLNRLVKPKI